MTRIIDRRVLGLPRAQNDATSELYFAKSEGHFIYSADTTALKSQEITITYLSFTNVRISIAVSGCDVSFVGGTRRTGRRLRMKRHGAR
jgi:hypothetical protein